MERRSKAEASFKVQRSPQGLDVGGKVRPVSCLLQDWGRDYWQTASVDWLLLKVLASLHGKVGSVMLRLTLT